MPVFERDSVRLYYEVSGPEDGPAVLLIAPGGMKSAISFWASTPWNPIDQLQSDYRVVAMDQRNAGASIAPVSGGDGWLTYTDDQFALMDHLGIDKFHVAGMCIGGPYSLGLIQQVPQRVLSATLFQTIGRDNNRDAFYAMFDDWAEPLKSKKSATEEEWQAFRERMYGGNEVFFNVPESFVSQCPIPLLVFMGSDLYHPESSSRLVAELAPDVEFVESWKAGSDRDLAMQTFAAFVERTS
jgi:pimeloyl-ACP methyl ester carboxylesterase